MHSTRMGRPLPSEWEQGTGAVGAEGAAPTACASRSPPLPTPAESSSRSHWASLPPSPPHAAHIVRFSRAPHSLYSTCRDSTLYSRVE
eukprot:scaffold304091_cov33-Tisochrysis_lutea.AAC.1